VTAGGFPDPAITAWHAVVKQLTGGYNLRCPEGSFPGNEIDLNFVSSRELRSNGRAEFNLSWTWRPLSGRPIPSIRLASGQSAVSVDMRVSRWRKI
jgi:hypothetical protein